MRVHLDSAMDYLDFVAERHAVWERRQSGAPAPWTDDPVLLARPFTNVFRVLDPGSQFALTELLGDDPDLPDALARVLLYRWTNEPSFWQAVHSELGGPVMACQLDADLADLVVELRDVWGHRLWRGAYLTNPLPNFQKGDKGRGVVDLVRRMLSGPDEVLTEYAAATTQQGRVAALARPNRMGTFMAQQVVTDLGYLYGYDEDEYVATGPGSRLGSVFIQLGPEAALSKTSGQTRAAGLSRAQEDALVYETLAWARSSLQVRLELPSGATRAPSLMDLQNTLCEYSKYYRAKLKLPKTRYKPSGSAPTPPVYPQHWL